MDVLVSTKVLTDLRARYSGCLCPRCLAIAAERGVSQLGA
jgi:hypothetical protein